ncbi:hypothetical protein ACL9RL_18445 [Plantibacter sp. Mn2098]|uniref:hypothetical protein n=1 Tax=Plantibacter sp. Mn2098 TaxID=3395266 RepID=UPI003BE98D98
MPDFVIDVAPSLSSFVGTAWDLTRRISPRVEVRVMQRDVYGRLDENQYPWFYRVGPMAPSTPWCVRLADEQGLFRLLCFDFDGKDAHGVNDELMEQAADECDALSRILDELAIAHVICQSSGTGGRHIWLAVQGGAAASTVAGVSHAARANYRTLDHGMLLNARQGAARPPLSPHRDGSTSTILRGDLTVLVEPSTTPAQLQELAGVLDARKPALRSTDSSPSGPINDAHQTHRPLSAKGAAHMATIGGGANPSWTGFMCLLAAAHAGWSAQDVEHAARTAPGMEHYRSRNAGPGRRRPRSAEEAARRLESQWAKAQQFAVVQRALPARKDPRDLSELTRIVEDADALLMRFKASPGRWARTEAAMSQRTVLSALAFLTLQTGKRTVAASIRELALLGGIGRTTVADALQVLAESGWVQCTSVAKGGNAAEWCLSPSRMAPEGGFSTVSGSVRSQPSFNAAPPSEIFAKRTSLVRQLEDELTDGRHDVFTRAGLGHVAGKVYGALRNIGQVSREDVARMMGVSLRHATTILSRLRTHRLLVRAGTGWRRSKNDLRRQAAVVLGVDGYLEGRAERYRIEREVWTWWQAEMDTMHSAPHSRPRRSHVTSRTLTFVEHSPAERAWPRYPRAGDGRGDHREARYWAENGMLSPDSLWWSSVA